MDEARQKAAEKRAAESLADLMLLRDRLKSENELDLLKRISICQEPLRLKCQICSVVVEVKQRCKRKWCPCCQRALAAQRTAELAFIVERFRHKLFVTLTMRNTADLSVSGVRHLRRAFGKLRHRQFWKETVRGGVAAVEVTNIGNGWHPHLHCVIDCRWLAIKTPAPTSSHTMEDKKALYKQAAQELERNWAKCLKQTTASVKVKRVTSSTVAKEVLKYSVTSDALIESEEPIGDLIRALESCRLMTTFGTAHGATVKQVRQDAKQAAKDKRIAEAKDDPPRCSCGEEEFLPAELVDRQRVRGMDGLELGQHYREIDRTKSIAKKPG